MLSPGLWSLSSSYETGHQRSRNWPRDGLAPAVFMPHARVAFYMCAACIHGHMCVHATVIAREGLKRTLGVFRPLPYFLETGPLTEYELTDSARLTDPLESGIHPSLPPTGGVMCAPRNFRLFMILQS